MLWTKRSRSYYDMPGLAYLERAWRAVEATLAALRSSEGGDRGTLDGLRAVFYGGRGGTAEQVGGVVVDVVWARDVGWDWMGG